MTTDVTPNTETATKTRGRPFLPGNNANPNGRPRKKLALRDLLTGVPLKQKRELIAVAYEMALDGDVHWAEWIAKHSGEGQTTGEAAAQVNVERGVFFLAMPGTTQE